MKISSINNFMPFRGYVPTALATEASKSEANGIDYSRENDNASKIVDYPIATADEAATHIKQVVKQGCFRDRKLNNTRSLLLSKTAIPYSQWLEQFDTPEERNLALKMLQNFLYIDLDNARKAFKSVHQDLASEIDIDKTKFATLGSAKSGSMMGYFYRQANKMRSKGSVQHEFKDTTKIPKQEQFLTHTELQNPNFNEKLVQDGFQNIVIVDDMIGDGDSLIEYFNDDVVNSLKNYDKVYYVTLIKDPDGEKKVKEKFPELDIQFRCAQEVLKYDSEDNHTFSDEEKAQIDEMLLKYGNRIAPELVDKYSRSKLLVSFDWNTPGNTPMIFNYSTDNWKALFERYNGLEKKDVEPNFNFCC